MIWYIQPCVPNQNAYIEHFNRTYRIDYNENRPHASLDDMAPVEVMERNNRNSILKLST